MKQRPKTLSQLRARMGQQMRVIAESGHKRSKKDFLDRWADRFTNTLIRSPGQLEQFVRGHMAHEMQRQNVRMRQLHGQELHFTAKEIKSEAILHRPDLDEIAIRKVRQIQGRVDRFNELDQRLGFGSVYQAMLNGDMPDKRLRKLRKLDLVIRNGKD